MGLTVTIDAMIAAGCTPEQIGAVVRAHQVQDEARAAARREKDAERKRNQRKREKEERTSEMSRGQGVTPRDKGFLGSPPYEIINSTPLSSPSKSNSSSASEDASVVEIAKPKRERRSEDVALIQAVVGDWNELAAGLRLPQVQDITPSRQAAILARAKDFASTYEFSDAPSGFAELFNRIRGSPFLRGETNGFRCDFDFVVRQSSFTKIMEGKYEARPQAAKTAYR